MEVDDKDVSLAIRAEPGQRRAYTEDVYNVDARREITLVDVFYSGPLPFAQRVEACTQQDEMDESAADVGAIKAGIWPGSVFSLAARRT